MTCLNSSASLVNTLGGISLNGGLLTNYYYLILLVYLRNNSSILYDSTRQGYTVYCHVLQIVMNIKLRIGFKCPKTYFAVEMVWRTLHNMSQIYVFNRVVELKLLTYLILIVTCNCIHLIYWQNITRGYKIKSLPGMNLFGRRHSRINTFTRCANL